MIIVGAGNLGKLILDQMLMDKHPLTKKEIVFFDEKTKEDFVFGTYLIIKKMEDLKLFLDKTSDKTYFIAIGNPRIRKKKDAIFKNLKANPVSIIPKLSRISDNSKIHLHLYLGYLSGIYHSCNIGYSNIIHSFVKISHGVSTGNFVNISPNVTVLADCNIGDYTFIGTNALIYPEITIGHHCYITAGSIIKKDMQDYETI
jgi:UDP-3-O-[3-hydroxymyristoyl] glucosamine N-acyltransferase